AGGLEGCLGLGRALSPCLGRAPRPAGRFTARTAGGARRRVGRRRRETMTKPEYTIEPAKQEIAMTRTFEAPRDLVFKTMTDPSLIPQWWGPRYLTTTVDEMDLRPGGRWRYLQRDPQGSEHAFHGVYHDIAAPERLVFTFEYEGVPGHVL